MEVLRGRQGREGFHNLTFASWCDLVWSEIWDDCPPLGDQPRYRDIMVRLIIDGDDPHNITWTDSDGKMHRLSETSRAKINGQPSKQQFADLEALQERIKKAQEAAKNAVASSGDG